MFDADDIMLPGKLRKSIETLEATPDAGFLFTNFECIDASGLPTNADFLAEYETLHRLPYVPAAGDSKLILRTDLLRGLSTANFVGTSSVVLRRSVVEQCGTFDETLMNGEDYHYWVRIASRFNGVFDTLPLHQYRRHAESISHSDPQR